MSKKNISGCQYLSFKHKIHSAKQCAVEVEETKDEYNSFYQKHYYSMLPRMRSIGPGSAWGKTCLC